MTATDKNMDQDRHKKLGTFSGVFTPSVLTILGIILFRRQGFVVGSSGLATALIIICIANLISILTSFSLAAIATNMRVKGGGDYYLISRTLGVEFGGAIGIVLFLAQSVSIGFYCIGFGEAVSGILRGSGYMISSQIIAFAALVFLFGLAWIGADLATKFQYIVMTFLVLALVSFYTGGIREWDSQLLMHNWTNDQPSIGFWALFAIFFPAVTGFTQGVSMSGDLENAGKSLPLGTFAAVGVSILVYFTAALVFSASNSIESLTTDYDAMKKTAAFGGLIDAGVIAATLSSAMASFLGAPRILQSLSADKIFKFLNMFAKGYGPGNNPRRCVLLSLVLAVAVISLGELDLIARIVSMFFLISYGLLNYATYFEASAQSPSFRPRFKWYHKHVSMAGFLACLAVMMAIDMKTAIASSAILFSIYQYLKRAEGPARWSDSQRSHHLQRIRSSLIEASKDLEHPREWRPYILLLSNDTQIIPRLLFISGLLEGASGITTAVNVVQGKGYHALKKKQKVYDELAQLTSDPISHAFPLVIQAMNTDTAVNTLFQAYGMGAVKANTILFSWKDFCSKTQADDDLPNLKMYLKAALRAKCNTLLVNENSPIQEPDENKGEQIRRIDVWWSGDDAGRLMLLLSYLATRCKAAQDAEINLMAVNYDRENKQVQDELQHILEDYRIKAAPSIILGLDRDVIIETSKDADMVFLPFGLVKDTPLIFSKFEPEIILSKLKITIMAMAAGSVDLDADPEQGKVGELTAVYDELEHAVKRAAAAEKEAVKAAGIARDKLAALKDVSDWPDKRKAKQLITAITEKVKNARQKAHKEKAKLEEVSLKAKEKGISPDTSNPQ